MEAWLDRGHGECWLRQPVSADLVENKLREYDGKSGRRPAWSVMPNQVHADVDALDRQLSQPGKLWNDSSAQAADLALGRGGSCWDRDYCETLIKDEEHLRKSIRYTGPHPVKAGRARGRNDWR